MEYRALGRTGVQVSALCLGCWQFGERATPEESERIINAALDADINFFDTANIYGGAVGRSEEIIGRVVKAAGKRDRLVLATKVHMVTDADDPNARGVSRRHIIEQCERSLRRLQSDWIDVYYLHRLPAGLPVDEPLRALDDLIRAGKVRYIGTSTTAAWQFVEALWASKELRLNRFVAETPPYNILDRRIEDELLPMAQTFGVAVNPWAPLGGSLLTGIYQRGEAPPAGSRFGDRGVRRIPERVHDVNDVLRGIAARTGRSVAAAALAWLLGRPGVTSPIVGPEKVSDLTDSLTALDVQLTAEELSAIDEVAPPGGMIARYYESDFGQFAPRPYRVF